MNTHDIELPPMPDLPAYSSEVFDREVRVVSETMAEQLMHDYARAAIEADRQQRGISETMLPDGVYEPSDDEIREVFLANGFTIKPGHDDLKQYVYDAARALLARYGQSGEPEGWRLMPKELIDFLDAKEHHLPVEDRHVLSIMLEDAPKFGEE